jgi:hypothetical protein
MDKWLARMVLEHTPTEFGYDRGAFPKYDMWQPREVT